MAAGWPSARALDALSGIGQGLLVGALGQAQPLVTDGQAGIVHHGEHAAHALILLAEEKAHRTVVVTVGHDAGGARLDAQLVLQRDAAQIVAAAEAAVVARQELGHQEQRDAFGPGRRAVEPRQHQMDDVLGQIVLAVGDEDLGAEDAVLVAVAHGTGT